MNVKVTVDDDITIPCAINGDNDIPHVPVLPLSTISVNGNDEHDWPINMYIV